MKIKFINPRHFPFSLILTVLGTITLSFATGALIIPHSLVVGGVSGIAIILNALFPLGESAWIVALTLALFILGLVALGGHFMLKTLISTLVYPIGVALFSRVSLFWGEELVFAAAILSGVLTGLGCAMVFLCGGSTGGVDILAFAVSRTSKRIRAPHVIFIIDTLVIVFGILIYRDLSLAMLGIVSASLTALVIEKIFRS